MYIQTYNQPQNFSNHIFYLSNQLNPGINSVRQESQRYSMLYCNIYGIPAINKVSPEFKIYYTLGEVLHLTVHATICTNMFFTNTRGVICTFMHNSHPCTGYTAGAPSFLQLESCQFAEHDLLYAQVLSQSTGFCLLVALQLEMYRGCGCMCYRTSVRYKSSCISRVITLQFFSLACFLCQYNYWYGYVNYAAICQGNFKHK